MSDQPQSSDGLVCPEAFPCKSADINTDNITSGAQSLRAMGNDVDARMDAIAGHWLGWLVCMRLRSRRVCMV